MIEKSYRKVQARNREESEGLPEPHCPFPRPQLVACAEGSNEAGKGTGPKSLEEYLEELRLFGLEKMQRTWIPSSDF